MSTTSRVAGAVAAGYVLGRFKKLRMAVLVASAMSSPKFRNAATEMIQSRIPGGAIVGGLTRELGGKLVGVGKTAATSIVASRIDSLSQNLAERSENLRKGSDDGKAPKPGAEESAEDREAEDEYEEQEDEEAEQPEDEYEEQEDDQAEQPEDQDAQADDTSRDKEPEEAVVRSPRRRRSASPAGRRRG